MVLSISLLIVLQVLWLRAEYRAASDSFRRETNLIFRSTVQHLSDSIFFSQLGFLAGSDSLEGGRYPFSRYMGRNFSGPDSLRIQFQGVDLRHHEIDSANAAGSRLTTGNSDEPDSLQVVMIRQGGSPAGNMRFVFQVFEHYNADSLAVYYHSALPERLQHLSFRIVENEVDWSRHGWGRPSPERKDSLHYMTNFIPFGMNKLYAADFGQVRGFLLRSLFPQIGFSFFITALILLSFILVYRTMKTQQRLIEQKNDFIGNMTHELKTPVATVGVALEAMQSFDVLKDPDKASEYIEMARHELDRLGMMTEKILRTSVFDYESEIRQNKTMVDMTAVAEKVCGSFQLVAEKNHTSLVCESAGSCTVLGHAEHLTQMLYNLADNAFKYAGHGPEIRITLEGDDNHLQLTVADQGPGIAPEHHTRIFEKFYRVPSGNVHTVKGYGLGLNYVAGVVKSHGGKIWLESKPGHGAAFIVKLPKNA